MEQLSRILSKIEGVIMVAGMAIMVTMNFANVIARKLFPSIPMSFTEEMVVLIFLWITMFGISYAYRRHSHTSLNLISEYLPRAGKVIISCFTAVVSCAFVAILAWTGWEMVQNYIAYGQILPSLKIPMAVQGFAVPIGGIIIIISVALSCCIAVKELLKKGDA